ncbi:hypothetical protein DFH28DRAFT_941451 [Melampsora americana]|nr:hypothetical protein DFH28DRAFT_941451 [Melampsora americana]
MYIRLFFLTHSFISTCYGSFGSDLFSAARYGVEPDSQAAETLMMMKSGRVVEKNLESIGSTVKDPMNPIQTSQSIHDQSLLSTPFEDLRKFVPSGKDKVELVSKETSIFIDPSPRSSIGTQESRTPLNKIQDPATFTEDGSSSRSTIDTLSDLRGEFSTPDQLKGNPQYWQGKRTQVLKSPRKRPWGANFLTETDGSPAARSKAFKAKKVSQTLSDGYSPLETDEVLKLFSNGAKDPAELTRANERLSPELYAKYFQKGTGGSEFLTSTAQQREFISLGISVPAIEQGTLDKFVKFVVPQKDKWPVAELVIKDFNRRARESAIDWKLLADLEDEAKVKFEGMLSVLSNQQLTKEQSLERLNQIKVYIENHPKPNADVIASKASQNTQKWENGGYIKFLEPFKALSTDQRYANQAVALSLRHTVRMLDKEKLIEIQRLSENLGDISSLARASGSRFLENKGFASQPLKKGGEEILELYQQFSEGSKWTLLTQYSKESLRDAVQARVNELKLLNHQG